jgi:nucleotide-binding universal stress UspA family protein
MPITLLCGTDLGDSARPVVDFASLLAHSAQARLLLVHVQQAAHADSAGAEQALEREQARCQQRHPGLECETLLTQGEAWLQLPEIARAQQASLIVVGQHGAGAQTQGAGDAVRTTLLGTTTDRLVRYGGHPVLVVPASADTTRPLDGETWAVGIAFDKTAEQALSVAVDWAQRTQGKPWLVHVGPPKGSADVAQSDLDWEQRTEQRLRDLAQQHAGGAAHQLWTDYGRPSDVLEQAVDSVGARLLVLGTHGRHGLPRFFLGSVAERILRRSPRPVLVVGPGSD